MTKKRKKQKKIRLLKMLDKESYDIVLSYYLEAKTNKEVSREDFILFKSFLAKMVVAQQDYMDPISGEDISPFDIRKSPRWVTPFSYFESMQGRTELVFIKKYIELLKNKKFRPFNFNVERDYGLLI